MEYRRKGDAEKGIKHLKKALEYDADRPDILHGLGIAYFQMGMLEPAELWLSKAVKLDPGNPELRNNLSGLYLQLKRYNDAFRESDIALKDPDYRTPAAALCNRGIAEYNLGRTNKAEADFRSAIRHNPFYDLPHMQLGRIYSEQGDFDKAIRSFSDALKINDKNPNAYLKRGIAYWQRGLVTEAENDFSKILRLVPENNPIAKSAREWLSKIK